MSDLVLFRGIKMIDGVNMISTKEIVSICEEIKEPKSHFHIIRDVRKTLESLHPILGLDITGSYREEKQTLRSGKEETVQFWLDEELSMTLISGYSVPIRYAIIKRLKECERILLNQQLIDTTKRLEITQAELETTNQSLDLGRQYYRDLNVKFRKLEYNYRMLDFKVKGYGNRLTIRRYLGLNGMSCYNLEYELIYDPRPIVQFLQQRTYKDRDWCMDYASPDSKKLSVHFTPHVLCFYHDDIMFMAQQLKEQALAKTQKGNL